MRKVTRARGADQLLNVERNPPELDRRVVDIDERVFARGSDADRADAEPQCPIEAAQPLLVDVADGNRVRLDALERAYDFGGRRRRKDHVLVRLRRRMAAEQPADFNRRLEPTKKRQPVFADLLARPAQCLQHSVALLLVVDLLGAEIERDKKVVGVSAGALTTELTEKLHALTRLRSALGDVAQRDDQVDVLAFNVRERSSERNRIAVHIREEGGSHPAELMGTP